MALHAMPIVMINLGTEMIYILEQRLKAQEIPSEKGFKVLKDVALTMFDATFYEEVFKPQEVYTIVATRQVFDRLAHSSIMRLSTSSMDKLYDLMLMGLKYQTLCSRKPSDILQVTLKHLGNVASMVNDPTVHARVASVTQQLMTCVDNFTSLHWIQLRQALLRFLKDKRVKVSLFLQEGIQLSSGKILLPLPLPSDPNAPQPGAIRAFDASGDLVSDTATIRLKSVEVNTVCFHCHPHPLGDNLYDKSRKPFKPPKQPDAAGKGQPAVDPGINSPKHSSGYVPGPPAEKTLGTAEAMMAEGIGKAGKQELNALAMMIATRSTAEEDNFKLNLFPDDDKEAPVATDMSSFSFDPVVKTVNMEASGNRQHLDKLMSEMDVKDSGAGGDDDLLDLLDKAA